MLVIAVSSFLVSLIFTALTKRLAGRVGFVAHPVSDRHHRTAVPLGGGIAIFAALIMAMSVGIIVLRFLSGGSADGWFAESVIIHRAGFVGRFDQLIALMLCMLVLFLLGLWDDLRSLGPFFKLVVLFAVAVIAGVFADVRVEFFIENKVITTLLSAFWIVLIINAFNFLDNMDGAAAGIATICASILFVPAAMNGQVFVGALALSFIAVMLGFLVFNFPPARIFMGDAGSLTVGFIIAVLTLKTTYYQEAGSGCFYPVFMPLLVMAVPLYDFLSVTTLRIRQGKSPFVGDTQHFSHRLKRCGLTDTQVVLSLYLATLCTGLGATFLYQVDLAGAVLIFIQTALILVLIAIFESTVKNGTKRY